MCFNKLEIAKGEKKEMLFSEKCINPSLSYEIKIHPRNYS